MKRLISGRTHVLPQIHRRCAEVGNGDIMSAVDQPMTDIGNKLPIAGVAGSPRLIVNDTVITCHMPDCVVIIDERPAEIVEIVHENCATPCILFKYFSFYSNFYFQSIPSSFFHIYKVGSLGVEVHSRPVTVITSKCIKLPLPPESSPHTHVIVPILHTCRQ